MSKRFQLAIVILCIAILLNKMQSYMNSSVLCGASIALVIEDFIEIIKHYRNKKNEIIF